MVRMLPSVVTLFCLGLASMNPLTNSVALADESHVDKELADLLRYMQEETSVSRESLQPSEPSLLDVANTRTDSVEASEPERGDSRQVVGATTSRGLEDKVSVRCSSVPDCGE
jgi:hypothetical protein